MNKAYDGLEPRALWRYFDMISQIPRGSGNEAGVLAAIKKVGEERGLEVREDKVGNLVLVIPAAKGCEDAPTVVLQGHVDMVCEKNNDTEHDFLTEGIKVVREGEWLTADGTTLGADNGVAVAAALAMLDDAPERHPRLELLFTVDEERGLTGAAGIEGHMLEGRVLLNMDSEEEGFVTVGCAGGGDTRIELSGDRAPVAGMDGFRLTVKGLKGGHSGIDIHENRANSIRCLGLLLDRLNRRGGQVRILDVDGGSMRNAIPREATALVALAPGQDPAAVCAEVEGELKADFGPTDPNLQVLCEKADATGPAFTAELSRGVITLMAAIPTGVLALNRDILGLPEISTNLGVVKTEGDTVRYVNCSRSSTRTSLASARQALLLIGEAVGAKVTLEADYPGWKPNLDSKLLAFFKNVHKEVLGREPEVMAIHAGLECGILGEHFPGMDMISFGPDMESVHCPDERLHIASTERFYKLLKALLSALTN